MKSLYSVICSAAAVLAFAGVAAACPNCADTIANTSDTEAVALSAGINYSIFAMLGGLFVVIGLVAHTLIKAVRVS